MEPVLIVSMVAGVLAPIALSFPIARRMMRPVPKPRPRPGPIPAKLKGIARLIVQFYGEKGIPVTPISGTVNYMTSQIAFLISPSVQTRSVERMARDLEHYLRAHDVRLVPNTIAIHVSGTMTVTFSHGRASPVLLSRLFKQEQPLHDSFIVGVDMEGKIARLPLDRASFPHSIVIGSTGSGKTILLLTLAANALYLNMPIYVFNPKPPPVGINGNTGLWALKDVRGVTYVSEYEDMLHLAGKLALEMTSLTDPILVLVDETADIFSASRECAEHFGLMAQKGREYGLHLIVSAAKVTKGVLINDHLHANVGTSLVGLKMNSKDLSRWGTGIGGLNLDRLSGNGHCIVKLGSDVTEIQVALPDNLDALKVFCPQARAEKILPIVALWIEQIPVGGDVSRQNLRSFASAKGVGLGYSTIQSQYQMLVEQGRIDDRSKNIPGVKLR